MRPVLISFFAMLMIATAYANDICTLPVLDNFVQELPPQDSLYDFPLTDLKLASETSNYSGLPASLIQGAKTASELSRVFTNDIGHRAIAEAFWSVGYRTKADVETLLNAIPNMKAEEQKKLASKAVEFLDAIYNQEITIENAREVKKIARQLDLNFSQFADVSREYQVVRENKENVELALLFLMDTTTSERQATLKGVLNQMPRQGFLGIGKRPPVLDAELPNVRRLKSSAAPKSAVPKPASDGQQLVPTKLTTGFLKSKTAMLPLDIVDTYNNIKTAGGPKEAETYRAALNGKIEAYVKKDATVLTEDDIIVMKTMAPWWGRNFSRKIAESYIDEYKKFLKDLLVRLDSPPSPQFFKWIVKLNSDIDPDSFACEVFQQVYPDFYNMDGPIKR